MIKDHTEWEERQRGATADNSRCIFKLQHVWQTGQDLLKSSNNAADGSAYTLGVLLGQKKPIKKVRHKHLAR